MASALLAEAGYPDGFTIDVLNSNRNGLESLWLQAVSGYLAEVGVQVVIHEPEGSGVLEALQNATYPAFTFFGQIEEPNLLVQEQLVPDAGLLNPFKYEDRTLLDLYDEFQTSSPEDQPGIQQQMTERIVSEGLYLTYSVSDVVYFHGPKVTGLDVSTAQPIMYLMTLAPNA